MDHLFRLVFGNKFLNQKIFRTISTENKRWNRVAFRYDEIESVEWLLNNGYISLFADKFRRDPCSLNFVCDSFQNICKLVRDVDLFRMLYGFAPFMYNNQLCFYASCIAGNFKVIQFLLKSQWTIGLLGGVSSQEPKVNSKIIKAITDTGRYHLIQWLNLLLYYQEVNSSRELIDLILALDLELEEIVERACSLPLVKRAWPWVSEKVLREEKILINASKAGDLATVKWIIENKFERYQYFNRLMENAVFWGHYAMVKYFFEYREGVLVDKCMDNSGIIDTACHSDNIEMIQYLIDRICEHDSHKLLNHISGFSLYNAVAKNHLATVRYIFNIFSQYSEIVWLSYSIESAIQFDNLEMVRFLYENRISPEISCENVVKAALEASLDLFIYLFEIYTANLEELKKLPRKITKDCEGVLQCECELFKINMESTIVTLFQIGKMPTLRYLIRHGYDEFIRSRIVGRERDGVVNPVITIYSIECFQWALRELYVDVSREHQFILELERNFDQVKDFHAKFDFHWWWEDFLVDRDNFETFSDLFLQLLAYYGCIGYLEIVKRSESRFQQFYTCNQKSLDHHIKRNRLDVVKYVLNQSTITVKPKGEVGNSQLVVVRDFADHFIRKDSLIITCIKKRSKSILTYLSSLFNEIYYHSESLILSILKSDISIDWIKEFTNIINSEPQPQQPDQATRKINLKSILYELITGFYFTSPLLLYELNRSKFNSTNLCKIITKSQSKSKNVSAFKNFSILLYFKSQIDQTPNTNNTIYSPTSSHPSSSASSLLNPASPKNQCKLM